MRTYSKVLAAVLMAGCAAGATAQERKKGGGKSGALKLEGGYTIVKGEHDGQPIPPERIKGSIILFTKDEVIGTDKDKKKIFVAKYTLDTSANPWKIRMRSTEPKEAETTGLIKKEGDTIVVIYALPGGKEPTEFKTHDKQHMFWLKNSSMGKGKKSDR